MASTRTRRQHANATKRNLRIRRGAGAVLTIAALAFTTSCTNAPQAIDNPSRVLQSVKVAHCLEWLDLGGQRDSHLRG